MGKPALAGLSDARPTTMLTGEPGVLAALWRQVRYDLTFGLAYYPSRPLLYRCPGLDAHHFLYQPRFIHWHSLTVAVPADAWRDLLLEDWPAGHPLPPPPAGMSRVQYRDTFGIAVVTRGVFAHGSAPRGIPTHRLADGSTVALPARTTTLQPAGPPLPA